MKETPEPLDPPFSVGQVVFVDENKVSCPEWMPKGEQIVKTIHWQPHREAWVVSVEGHETAYLRSDWMDAVKANPDASKPPFSKGDMVIYTGESIVDPDRLEAMVPGHKYQIEEIERCGLNTLAAQWNVRLLGQRVWRPSYNFIPETAEPIEHEIDRSIPPFSIGDAVRTCASDAQDHVHDEPVYIAKLERSNKYPSGWGVSLRDDEDVWYPASWFAKLTADEQSENEAENGIELRIKMVEDQVENIDQKLRDHRGLVIEHLDKMLSRHHQHFEDHSKLSERLAVVEKFARGGINSISNKVGELESLIEEKNELMNDILEKKDEVESNNRDDQKPSDLPFKIGDRVMIEKGDAFQ